MRFLATILFIMLTPAFMLHAQKKADIRASVTKNKILLGEPFQFILESNIPGGSIVRPVKIDSIPHFEFLEVPATDTVFNGKGMQIKAVYTLTSFDSGHWVIPSYYLSNSIRSDTIPIDVVFTESFDPNQPYHDIKDIIPVEEASEKTPWWYYAAGGFLLLILLVYLLTRKKKKPAVSAESIKDPYGEALEAMEKLRKNKGEPVSYYSALSGIFRLYVFKKKGIHSLQKTTHDLVVKLESLNPDRKRFDNLAQALRLGDFVKFAKYRPSLQDDEEAWLAVKQGIEEIERTA